ncbi:Por secretion system C-terminal sorting domain-containing protein [Psychroflexus sediminis]|uniref:Por secretion system C-terminal sorting domain-containing protein n=2 Tax=Psychroflexus sediminis TaxID=470826 RepID=A0A1G7XB75_9FLAO|nr:Por secretion system C-terminal sorting domain-containing protein [Psychroflexus sediminis]
MLCIASQAQNTLGTTFVKAGVYEGLTLMSVNTKAFLFNNCGEVINEWTSDYKPGNAVYLLTNGNLLRAGQVESGSSITMGGAGGIVELFDWDGNLLWSYVVNDDQKRQHHDIYPMPNGNVLILAATAMTEQEALEAGRNSSRLPDKRLYNEQIMELEPVGSNQANLVWEWNINQHLVQDFDATKSNYGVVSARPEKLDINFLNGGTGEENWLHFNSIQYDETLDQIVISCRNLSEIYIIDHSTTTLEAAGSTGGTYGKGGDILYRWGNPQAYQQGSEANRILYGQHYPHYIKEGLTDAGKIIVFNNGFGRTPDFSEVMIINPPVNSPGVYIKQTDAAFGPEQADEVYADLSEIPSPFFSRIVSSAQRLPNGNTLICEGINGEIFEIDANGDLVWTYINPVGNNDLNIPNQGEELTDSNLIFRAKKYPLDFPAFAGRDLSPGNPIEGNPDLSKCYEVLSTKDALTSTLTIYPNPASNLIHLEGFENHDKIEIFNLQGKLLLSSSGVTSVDISSLAKGIYILRAGHAKRRITKKIIKK